MQLRIICYLFESSLPPCLLCSTVKMLIYLFTITDSVENLMVDTHELGGSTVVVDRATPKASCFTVFLFAFNNLPVLPLQNSSFFF